MQRKAMVGWDALTKMHGNPVPGDIAGCMQEMGLEILRVADMEAHCRCPMHFERTGKEDRHPSFSVATTVGSFFCFSCGYSGNFWVLVKDVLQITKEEALAWCRERGGIERAKMLMSEDDSTSGPVDTTQNINEASLALFVDPPEEEIRAKRLTLSACRALGVLWDPDREMWIVPIRAPFGGRLMGWQEKNKRHFNNFPKSVRKREVLFGFDECEDDHTVIVVESPLDVVRMRAAGYTNVVATYGAANISEEQQRLLVDRFEVIIWALDNDATGKGTTKVMLELLRAYPIVQRVINYSQTPSSVKDPGDMTDTEIYYAIEKAHPALLWGKRKAA